MVGAKITGAVMGAIGAVLSLILVLLVIGNSGMVTQITSAFTGICDSGWPLATLFNATGGIVSMVLVVGLLIFAIVAAFKIGKGK